jgi:hypothetical protein
LDNALFRALIISWWKQPNQYDYPARLQNDLLDFSTYGLNDKWTVYHTYKQRGVNCYRNGYSFQSNIYFTRANQSDRVRKNAKLKDGSRKLLDDKGKEVLAEDGKVIMVDNFKM